MYSLDISVGVGRRKVREEFQRHSHIRDPRVIDMLVIKVWPKTATDSVLSPPSPPLPLSVCMCMCAG